LFEIGNVFIHKNSLDCLPDENVVVSGVLAGLKMDRGWSYPQEPIDFYDVKGIVEHIVRSLQCSHEFCRTEEIAFLHPGEAATVHIQDDLAGFVGKLHPDVPETFDIDEERIYVFELLVDILAKHASSRKTFRALPKFPAVYRDLALIAPALSVSVADIDAIIQEVGHPLLEHVVLFDRYVGAQIPQGSVGLTYSLQYRSSERTLTDHDVSEVHQRIVEQLQTRLGIQLR
jgi:phenylalanyl-tRNA synthetase beta chain